MAELTDIKTKATEAIAAANSTTVLEQLRVEYLGKKGEITSLLKQLGWMQPEERKSFGAEVNQVKDTVSQLIDLKKQDLEKDELNERLAGETLDISLPVHSSDSGRVHPISYVLEEIQTIFAGMGFGVATGPDIESEDLNFSALNIPAHHPARQMHDTFYMASEASGPRPVLRTHTSPVQIRTMRAGKPPMRYIAPGATYRCDSDQTHTPMFHQVEGFVIDKGIHMGHLKGCLTDFLKAFFEMDEVPVRFRPSYFPFTEPSSEVDIGCKRSKDSLEIGKGDDWLEILGCGMIHPIVLQNGNIDPDEYQGFAFGMGVERLAMLKYGIPDLRMFFESDLRWLRHYGFRSIT